MNTTVTHAKTISTGLRQVVAVVCMIAWEGSVFGQIQPPGPLTTYTEVQDGITFDIAAPRDATSQPSASRIWIAQGCVRIAIQASTRTRMPLEDATFPIPQNGQSVNETLLYVAVDDTSKYVYTLTPTTLYRESFASPYSQRAPGDRRSVVLTGTGAQLPVPLQSLEDIRDVQVINGQYCAVMTSRRIVVLNSTPALFGYKSETTEMLSGSTWHQSPDYLTTGGQDPVFDALQVNYLWKMRIALDHQGNYIAYCEAAIRSIAHSSSLSPTHRLPECLLLCKLGVVGEPVPFSRPKFNAGSSLQPSFNYWNPFAAAPAYPQAPDDEPRFHSLYDLSVMVDLSETRVYCACGKTKQVRVLRAAFASPNGVSELSTINVDGAENLFNCIVDPILATKLYVIGDTRVSSVDLGTLFVYADPLMLEWYQGSYGDPVFVSLLDGTSVISTIWTVGAATVTHVCKVFNVTPTQPQVYARYGGLWGSDGAVATDLENVYLITWAAVTHYRRVAGIWAPTAITQPMSSNGGIIPGNTEEIDIGTTAPGEQWLFIASNSPTAHGPMVSKLDQNGEAGPIVFLDNASLLFGQPGQGGFGWATTDDMNTDEVTYAEYQGAKLALCDVRNGTRNSGALLVYRLNPIQSSWSLIGNVLLTNYNGYTTCVRVIDGNGKEFACVAGYPGVFTADLSPILSGQPISVSGTLFPSAPQGASWNVQASCVSASGDKLFVCYNAGPDAPASGPSKPEIAIYQWDQTTGAITASPLKEYFPTDSLDQLYMQDYGAVSFSLRFRPANALSGFLYNPNGNRLFEMWYDSNSVSLSYLGRWVGNNPGAYGLLTDARPYSFGGVLRTLVSKSANAFAWITENP